jgi:hypothetical protein
MSEPEVESYVCGICKKEVRGSPSGGVFTRKGVVWTCSSDCVIKAYATLEIVSMEEMNHFLHHTN